MRAHPTCVWYPEVLKERSESHLQGRPWSGRYCGRVCDEKDEKACAGRWHSQRRDQNKPRHPRRLHQSPGLCSALLASPAPLKVLFLETTADGRTVSISPLMPQLYLAYCTGSALSHAF